MKIRLCMLIALTSIITVCNANTDETQNLVIPIAGKFVTTTNKYLCNDGTKLGVTYYNQDTNSVALLTLPSGEKVITVNVISGSGLKYDGNIYEWWTKGETGTFSNLMEDKNTECKLLK